MTDQKYKLVKLPDHKYRVPQGSPEELIYAGGWNACLAAIRSAPGPEHDLRAAVVALRQHLALFCGPDDAVANALFAKADAAIAAAPEPVCRWRNPQSRENGYSWVAGCGLEWDFGDWDANPGNSDVTFCPRCGKKVEVVKDE